MVDNYKHDIAFESGISNGFNWVIFYEKLLIYSYKKTQFSLFAVDAFEQGEGLV